MRGSHTGSAPASPDGTFDRLFDEMFDGLFGGMFDRVFDAGQSYWVGAGECERDDARLGPEPELGEACECVFVPMHMSTHTSART